jgi:hypothetical protein
MKRCRSARPVVVACVCLISCAIPAYGYVDPNASGLISQILTPLLIAGAAGLTFLRRRVGAVVAGLVQRLRRKADA